MSESVRGRVAGRLWAWRREAAVAAAVVATAGVPLMAPRSRRLTRALYRSARTRRLLHASFAELRIANAAGRMPRIARVRPMPFGERVELRVRAGQWAELFEVRAAALAAACRAATVRVDKNDTDASRVSLDVVRLDPLAKVGDVPWLGLDADELSMWDPIHIGTTELGGALYLDLLGRGHLLAAGLSGSGKSTFLRLVASQAAKSRCHMVLIDPNRVQFAPWRERALAYASQDSGLEEGRRRPGHVAGWV